MTMDEDMIEALRRELQTAHVPFDAARAEAMIAAATGVDLLAARPGVDLLAARPEVDLLAARPGVDLRAVRRSRAPLAAAAAVLAVSGGIAALAAHHGNASQPAAGGGPHRPAVSDSAPYSPGYSGPAVSDSAPYSPGYSGPADSSAPATPRDTPTAFTIETHAAAGARPGVYVYFDGPRIRGGDTLVITEMTVRNPNADTGSIRIVAPVNDSSLTDRLENIRSLVVRYDSNPLIYTATTPLRVGVDCANASGQCTPSVRFVGRYVQTTTRSP